MQVVEFVSKVHDGVANNRGQTTVFGERIKGSGSK